MEWYRDDLDEARSRDPYPVFLEQLRKNGFSEIDIKNIENDAQELVAANFELALKADDPRPEDLFTHDFAPTPIVAEAGNRIPEREDSVVMVDCALFAVEELMRKHPECLLY
jgi:2-oxoisovalerate dehydrogenase E1 component